VNRGSRRAEREGEKGSALEELGRLEEGSERREYAKNGERD
jgi:hypothetical protein